MLTWVIVGLGDGSEYNLLTSIQLSVIKLYLNWNPDGFIFAVHNSLFYFIGLLNLSVQISWTVILDFFWPNFFWPNLNFPQAHILQFLAWWATILTSDRENWNVKWNIFFVRLLGSCAGVQAPPTQRGCEIECPDLFYTHTMHFLYFSKQVL